MIPDSTLEVTDFATRFLLPFRFRSDRTSAIRDTLAAAGWLPHPPHTDYRADYLPQFLDTYFGSEGAWQLFQRDLATSQKKPGQNINVVYRRTSDCNVERARLVHGDGRSIELFLGPNCGGVVSIALCPRDSRKTSLTAVKSFNYALSQDVGSKTAARVRKAEGQGYGDVVLKDLLLEFLSPLGSGGGFELIHPSAQLIPYTVVRFGSENRITSLSPPEGVMPQDDLAAQASVLAQVDEALHPLPISDDRGALVRVFHMDELAAVSCSGAAFCITDVGTEFDPKKLHSRLDKYFLCFLAAILQKMRLRALAEEAAATVRAENETARRQQLESLRSGMLDVIARGDFVEISARDSVNRFLSLCQQALRVPESLNLLKSAIADLDTSIQASQQSDSLRQLNSTQEALQRLSQEQGAILAEQTKHSLHMANAQNKLEWIEIFIVSFYSAELVELLGKEFSLNHGFVQYSVLAAAIGAAVITAFALRPWDESAEKHQTVRSPGGFLTVVGTATAAVLLFIFVGRTFGQWTPSEQELLKTELQRTNAELQALRAELVKAVAQSKVEHPETSNLAHPATRLGAKRPVSH